MSLFSCLSGVSKPRSLSGLALAELALVRRGTEDESRVMVQICLPEPSADKAMKNQVEPDLGSILERSWICPGSLLELADVVWPSPYP